MVREINIYKRMDTKSRLGLQSQSTSTNVWPHYTTKTLYVGVLSSCNDLVYTLCVNLVKFNRKVFSPALHTYGQKQTIFSSVNPKMEISTNIDFVQSLYSLYSIAYTRKQNNCSNMFI